MKTIVSASIRFRGRLAITLLGGTIVGFAGFAGTTPDGSSGGVAAGLEREVVEREYRLTWQEGAPAEGREAAWHAPNRAQGFRTYFASGGVVTVPRDCEGNRCWSRKLVVVAYGRGSVPGPVQSARLLANGNAIELNRGDILEWYRNDRRGLQQGFVLGKPPESGADGSDSSAPIRLTVAIGGDLSPIVTAEGCSVEYTGPSSLRVLSQKNLEAWDATGRSIPVRFERSGTSSGHRLHLIVDDDAAAYPLTVQSLTSSAAWTAEGDQAGAQLGISVASAGDVNADGFDDVIVGAMAYDNGETNEGAAFLYLGSAAGLGNDAVWMTESDATGARLGRTVGTAGDVNGDGFDDLILGAPYMGNGAGAWVFHGSPSGPEATADWLAYSTQSGSSFGFSVGAAGDVNGDGFDDVIVGAHLFDVSPSLPYAGRAFVYLGSPTGLQASHAWTGEGNRAGARYGISVGTAGDVNGDSYADVVVGAYGDVPNGRAFLYHGSSAGLSSSADWSVDGGQQFGACLGGSVGTAGDVNGDGYDDVAVGANFGCAGAGTGPGGLAFVFHGSESTLSATADWSAAEPQIGALFGSSVGTAGDVNRDGYDDLIVGALLYDNGETDEGRASLFLGSPSGLSTEAVWTTEGEQAGAELGRSGTAGDVNGDGFDDVIVSAWLGDNEEVDEGRAFVFHGAATPGAAGSVESTLALERTVGGDLRLTWEASCVSNDSDYEVYEGQLGDFTTHASVVCSTAGETSVDIAGSAGDSYYLVVPRSADREGAYGDDGWGRERPPATEPCLPRTIVGCDP